MTNTLSCIEGSRHDSKKPLLAASEAGPIAIVPPLNEQAAIVRYLDDADQRIRAYVSAKERLIALLEEERQAVIHQAVTRGLDPNVKLKPSGVEWLGDVPEHWEVAHSRHKYSPNRLLAVCWMPDYVEGRQPRSSLSPKHMRFSGEINVEAQAATVSDMFRRGMRDIPSGLATYSCVRTRRSLAEAPACSGL